MTFQPSNLPPSLLDSQSLQNSLGRVRQVLARKRAQESFLHFIEQLSPEQPPARHHRLLIDKLEKVASGEISRLMIWMPPGSAKSTYASVLFPAWYLGNNPQKNIIAASYGQELADKFGRRVRGLVKEPDWEDIFGGRLSDASQATNRWALESGGEYFAVGVGGGIAGYRADLGVIDDPIKNREEADSEGRRDKIKDWYRSDFWPRLKPGAGVVIINTRWHEDDLSGWLLEEEKNGGEKWEVLSLPALAEEDDPLGRAPGEPLWPEWFTPEMFAHARRDPRTWSALYQQRPAPEDGDYFKSEWIRWYDLQDTPKHLRYYGASDYAVSENGDYTVHMVVGVDPNDDIYIIDVWRDRTDSLGWVEALIEMILIYKPLEWGEGSDHISKSLDPLIDKRQREEKAFCYRRQFTMPRGGANNSGKMIAAQAIRGRMAQGKVYLPKHKPWADQLLSELLKFPAGKHDDQVDALAIIGRMLTDMVRADSPPRPRVAREPTVNELFEAHIKKSNRKDDD